MSLYVKTSPVSRGITRQQFLRMASAGACHMLLAGCDDSSGSSGRRDEDGMPLYLTYDDGPSRHTLDLLDALQGAPATFFMMGAHVNTHPGIARLVQAEGHAIGNHSFGHPHFDRLTDERIVEEIENGGEAIRRALGFTPALFRPPYLSGGDRARRLAEERGYRVVYGSNTHDYEATRAATIVDRVLQLPAPGAILFFHDSDPTDSEDRRPTVDATRILVPKLREMGYGLRKLRARS